MRKKVFGKNFSRARKSRLALARSLMEALVLSGKVTTTKTKAQYLAGYIDKEVSRAKKQTVPARRRVLSDLGNRRTVTDSIFEIAQKFTGQGSIARIVPLPNRKGDNAEMASVELLVKPEVKVKETVKKEEAKPIDFSGLEKPKKKLTLRKEKKEEK